MHAQIVGRFGEKLEAPAQRILILNAAVDDGIIDIAAMRAIGPADPDRAAPAAERPVDEACAVQPRVIAIGEFGRRVAAAALGPLGYDSTPPAAAIDHRTAS